MYLSLRGVLEVRVSFFASIVCWLLEPEVGVALGQTGLLRCAAARFSLGGLQHSGGAFVGRVHPNERMAARVLCLDGFGESGGAIRGLSWRVLR